MAARPELVHIRAEDGRGPLWWAYEYQEAAVIDFLLARPGMRTDLRDKARRNVSRSTFTHLEWGHGPSQTLDSSDRIPAPLY